jgi:stress response protein YsnF
MTEDLKIPIVEEEARVTKRVAETERVSVRSIPHEEHVVIRDELRRDEIEVTRIPIGREVAEAPGIRSEGHLTIVPVVEERLIVEKRLFLVEELHIRRTTHTDPVEIPAVLRSTRVEVDREKLDQQEDI